MCLTAFQVITSHCLKRWSTYVDNFEWVFLIRNVTSRHSATLSPVLPRQQLWAQFISGNQQFHMFPQLTWRPLLLTRCTRIALGLCLIQKYRVLGKSWRVLKCSQRCGWGVSSGLWLCVGVYLVSPTFWDEEGKSFYLFIIIYYYLFILFYFWRYKSLWVYFHSPVAGFSLLVFEFSWTHTTTRHSR